VIRVDQIRVGKITVRSQMINENWKESRMSWMGDADVMPCGSCKNGVTSQNTPFFTGHRLDNQS
jgi:hypothetical protein